MNKCMFCCAFYHHKRYFLFLKKMMGAGFIRMFVKKQHKFDLWMSKKKS